MGIYDILHGSNQPDDSAHERRKNNQRENCQGSSDDRKPSSAAHQSYKTMREKKLEEIRIKINSGYYEQREVLEKVADAIYRHIRK